MKKKLKEINKSKLTTISLMVICALFVIGLTSYAAFSINITGLTNIKTKVPTISLTYEEDQEALISDEFGLSIEEGKMQEEYFEFTVSALSSIEYDMHYRIYMTGKESNTLSEDNIYVYLTEVVDSVETEVLDATLLSDLENHTLDYSKILTTNNFNWISSDINTTKTKTYRLRTWSMPVSEITTEEDGSQSLIITGGTYEYKVHVETITPPVSLYSLVASQSLGTDAENNIVYTAGSSDTNGKGVYTLSSTVSDEYPVYFYRGEVYNNNVVFGKYCWKIVRTTSTGGVKLIYNGEYTESNKCNNTGTASQLENKSEFNSNEGAYSVGYYYDTSNTMETMNNGTALNTEPSTIATAINTWYASEESGMTSLTYMLENEKWCSDRTNIFDEDWGTNNFGARTRHLNGSPSIECPNNNDAFTLSVSAGGTLGYGNNVLPYPIGLLTADEANLAGFVHFYYGDYPEDIYLDNGDKWGLLSPDFFDGDVAIVFIVYYEGLSENGVDYRPGVRPSVSLIPGAEIEEGNTGTASDPYVVVLK